MKWMVSTAIVAVACLVGEAGAANWPSLFGNNNSTRSGSAYATSGGAHEYEGLVYGNADAATYGAHGGGAHAGCCDSVWDGFCGEQGHGHCWLGRKGHGLFGNKGCGCDAGGHGLFGSKGCGCGHGIGNGHLLKKLFSFGRHGDCCDACGGRGGCDTCGGGVSGDGTVIIEDGSMMMPTPAEVPPMPPSPEQGRSAGMLKKADRPFRLIPAGLTK
ncbi:MAG: hypothetical protein WDZ59_11995 [Pirellulales bacterium]